MIYKYIYVQSELENKMGHEHTCVNVSTYLHSIVYVVLTVVLMEDEPRVEVHLISDDCVPNRSMMELDRPVVVRLVIPGPVHTSC